MTRNRVMLPVMMQCRRSFHSLLFIRGSNLDHTKMGYIKEYSRYQGAERVRPEGSGLVNLGVDLPEEGHQFISDKLGLLEVTDVTSMRHQYIFTTCDRIMHQL